MNSENHQLDNFKEFELDDKLMHILRGGDSPPPPGNGNDEGGK